MPEDMRKHTCRRCGIDIEVNEIHLFRGGEDRRRAVEEEFKTKVTLCANPLPESFWKDIRAEDFEEYMLNEIIPIASVKDVIEGTDSWSVIIEIPKPKLKALLPRPGEGLPILGDVYSLEIIQDKQSIADRVTGKYEWKGEPNSYIGACHIPDPINRDFCMICGKRTTVDSTKEE